MLRSLRIRDFAIISELNLEPGRGLNVFTGETGAGKSILIEALGFLLGTRATTAWLRAGASRLSVEGIFDPGDFSTALRGQFQVGSAPAAVRRELDASGKSRASLNGRPAGVAVLAAFGEGLVDFHGQHEHQSLLKPAAQLEALDSFAALGRKREELAGLHRAWVEATAELDSARMSDSERRRRIEFDRFQVQEIDAAKLRPGEEAELEADLPLLKNADRIRNLADSAYGLLYAGGSSALEALQKSVRVLEDLSRFDESLRQGRDELETACIAVDEVAHRLGELRRRVGADPARLDALLGRQDELARLKKKYGATVAEVLAKREELAAELDRLENSQKRIADLEASQTAARRAAMMPGSWAARALCPWVAARNVVPYL